MLLIFFSLFLIYSISFLLTLLIFFSIYFASLSPLLPLFSALFHLLNLLFRHFISGIYVIFHFLSSTFLATYLFFVSFSRYSVRCFIYLIPFFLQHLLLSSSSTCFILWFPYSPLVSSSKIFFSIFPQTN